MHSCHGLTISCLYKKKPVHQSNGFDFHDYPFEGSVFLIFLLGDF